MSGVGRRRLLALACAAGVALRTRAQGAAFPSRPVRLVLGFAPAGSGDQLARALQPIVGQQLGQQLVIENRPGAATNLASEFVARSAPDGHTLLLGGNFSHSVNPALFARLPFDPQADFVPILKVGSGSSVIVVPQSLPVASFAEFLAWARREGDKVNYASSGIGSPGHIAGAYLNRQAGLQMVHVPYKGGSEAVRAAVAGEVQMIITSYAAVRGLVKDGRLKPLALTTPGRNALYGDIPGSDEAGLKDFNLGGWYGVFAPAQTPPAVVARLHAVFAAALQDPATVATLKSIDMNVETVMSTEAFADFVRKDAQAWRGIVLASGAKVE